MRVIYGYSKFLTGYVIMSSTCTRPARDWTHQHCVLEVERAHETPPFPEYLYVVNDCWKKGVFFPLATGKEPMLLLAMLMKCTDSYLKRLEHRKMISYKRKEINKETRDKDRGMPEIYYIHV